MNSANNPATCVSLEVDCPPVKLPNETPALEDTLIAEDCLGSLRRYTWTYLIHRNYEISSVCCFKPLSLLHSSR